MIDLLTDLLLSDGTSIPANCPYFYRRKRRKRERFYQVSLFLQRSVCSKVMIGNSGMSLFLRIFLPFVPISEVSGLAGMQDIRGGLIFEDVLF